MILGQLEINQMLKPVCAFQYTVAHTGAYTHTAMKREMEGGNQNRGKKKKCVWLTAVAGGSRVTRIGTIAMKGVPGLGALPAVFTVVGQTPKRRCRHSYYLSLGDTEH